MFSPASLMLMTVMSVAAGHHSNHPLVMIVSFDGFRADYMDKTDTPNFDGLVQNGVKAQWLQPSFPSLTFPNHHTIATGLFPESHGIVANGFYDPILDEVFTMDSIDSKWWDTGSTPLYILNELAGDGRHSGVMMWVGSASSYFNHTATHVRRFDHSLPWVERVDNVIDWLTDDEKPANNVFMYFEQPDESAHQFGPDSEEVKEQIRRADNITGYLVSRLVDLDLFDKIDLIVTSDHGMAHVPLKNSADLTDVVDRTRYQYFDYSPVVLIRPETGFEDVVYAGFKNASTENHYNVYHRQDIPEEYHYRNNDRISPIVIVTEENYTVSISTNYTHLYGQHGFNNSLPTMHALFLAHGPSFKSNYIAQPFHNVDIYPLASHLLGLQPAPNNGSFDDVKDLLKTPSTLMQKISHLVRGSRSSQHR